MPIILFILFIAPRAIAYYYYDGEIEYYPEYDYSNKVSLFLCFRMVGVE